MFIHYHENPQALARVLAERSRRLFCALNFSELSEDETTESKAANANEANAAAEWVKSDLAACKTDVELKQVMSFWMAVIRYRLAMNDESSSVFTSFVSLQDSIGSFPLPTFLETMAQIDETKNLFPHYLHHQQWADYCKSILTEDLSQQTKILNVLPFLAHLFYVKERAKISSQASQERKAQYLTKMQGCFQQLQERARTLVLATEQELASFELIVARQKRLPQFLRVFIDVYQIPTSVSAASESDIENTYGFYRENSIVGDFIERCALKSDLGHHPMIYILNSPMLRNTNLIRTHILSIFDFSMLNNINLIRVHLMCLATQFKTHNQEFKTIQNFHLRIQIKINTSLVNDVAEQIKLLQAELFDIWDPKLRVDFTLLITDENSNVLRVFLDTSDDTEKYNKISSTMGVMGFLINRESNSLNVQRRQHHSTANEEVMKSPFSRSTP